MRNLSAHYTAARGRRNACHSERQERLIPAGRLTAKESGEEWRGGSDGPAGRRRANGSGDPHTAPVEDRRGRRPAPPKIPSRPPLGTRAGGGAAPNDRRAGAATPPL